MRSEKEHGAPARPHDTGTLHHHDAGTAAMVAELGHHTGLLQRIHDGIYGELEHLPDEDTQTFAFPSGSASAFVFAPGVANTGAVEVEAWLSGVPGVPLFILDGQYTQAQAAALLGAGSVGFVPVLCAAPTPAHGGGVRRPSFSGNLTICSLGSPTALALLTVTVRGSLK